MFELIDHSARLFGREGDLLFLTGRAATRGLTAIVARPQMGKSWLMVETARRLGSDRATPTLVGFAEATGTTSDLLLRAVSDLYERWLSQASFDAQFNQVWAQQKDRLLPGVAKAVSGIFEALPLVGKAVGGLIDKAFDGLLAADQDLKSGRLVLPPLEYEQARDLVRAVSDLSGRPVALFLDAWQLSSKPAETAVPLASFVRKRDDWPPCHIFLSLTEDPAAEAPLRAIAAGEAGAAVVRQLAPIDLADPEEERRATSWLRENVPATAACDDATLVGLVDGYPGIIYRWTSEQQRTTMRTLADLRRVADDAQAYRFSDLEALLGTLLDKDARRLAIRVALTPLAGTADGWAVLRGPVTDGLEESLLDDLSNREVLTTGDPPSYGHGKRAQAAREWFAAKRPVERRQEAERLCLTLGRGIADVSSGGYPLAAALRDLDPIASTMEFDPWARALARAATTLFGTPTPTAPLLAAPSAKDAAADAGATLLAMGLSNGMHFAFEAHEPSRAAALLARLQALTGARPGDARLADLLAGALSGALWDALEAGDTARVALALADLRKLARSAPHDVRVRAQLAQGLYNTLRHRDEAGDGEAATELLDELRALVAVAPDDPAAAEALGRGLYQLGSVSAQVAPGAQESLQRELLALATRMRGRDWFDRVLAARAEWVRQSGDATPAPPARVPH